MKYYSIEVRWLEFGANTDGQAYFTLIGVDTCDWGGALLQIERGEGDYRFDFLFMRRALYWFRDWLDGNA